MTLSVRCGVVRAAGLALLLALPGLGRGDEPTGRGMEDGADFPAIRKVFVPAAEPEQWPAGPWEPIDLATFERKLDNAANNARIAPGAGLERAEYHATLVNDELERGTLEWTPRQSLRSPSFVRLHPLNLAVSNVNWVRPDGAPPCPAIWGTTPSHEKGLLLEEGALVEGEWTLRGRRLIRSTEFEVRLPAATVSRMTLQAPRGLVLTATAGEVSGPRPARDPQADLWELHLGTRTMCRLRFSPPPVDAVRRPLVTSVTRINYFVRPEVVRVVAEFDLDSHEGRIGDLRLLADESLKVTAVDYGDEGEVGWRVVEGTHGRELSVRLPDPLDGPGQTLRIHAVSLKSLVAWTLPRIRVGDAVESDHQVTIRLQPPYQAADLRFDGYRQTELSVSPSDGETVVARRLRPDATLTVVPAQSRLVASCRSVALAGLQGDEWTLTAVLDLRASSGSTFDIPCRIPAGWEIVGVQSEGDLGAGELSGWEVRTADAGFNVLELGFVTALSEKRAQRVRVSARRSPVPAGQSLAVPLLTCPLAADTDAVAVIVAEGDRRALLRGSTGFEALSLESLSAETLNVDFLQTLPPEARSAAVVVRANVPNASGAFELHPLYHANGNAAPTGRSGGDPTQPAGKGALNGAASPIVILSVDVTTQISGASSGFDSYRVSAAVVGPDGADLDWKLPAHAELIGARINDRPVDRTTDGSPPAWRLPPSAAGSGGRHILSLEYRTPVNRRFGPNRFRLALPVFECAVLACRLDLMVPAHLQLAGTPSGIEFTNPPRESVSLFGPLARSPGDPPFNPFRAESWHEFRNALLGSADFGHPVQVATVKPNTTSPDGHSNGDAQVVRWRATALKIPLHVELIVWERSQAQSLMWAAFWLGLLGTVVLRKLDSHRKRQFAVLVTAALAGAMCSLSPLHARIAGAALVGLAIGVLLPERLVRSTIGQGPREPSSVPHGSTRSFAAVTGLLLIALLPVAGALHAQDQATVPERVAQSPRRIDVLVPVGADGRPARPQVCYVPRGFLARLEGLDSHRAPSYLLSDCLLDAEIVEGRQVEIKATVRVYVLSNDETVSVTLPFVNAVLGGADACLVDGRPYPLLLAPGGGGLLLQLPGRPQRPPPVPLPSPEDGAAARSAGPGGEDSTSPPSAIAYRIELRLFPQVELEANESYRARLGIPPLNDTRVDFNTKGAGVPAIVLAAAGDVPQSFGPRQEGADLVTARTGPTTELSFRWSRSPAPRAGSAELDATVSALVDVSGALATTTYHVGYRVLRGTVDSLEWRLPAGATLLSVQAPGLSGSVIEGAEGGGRRLFLEFVPPQTGSLSITATLAQPLSPDTREHTLALLDTAPGTAQIGHTIVRRYLVGFRSPIDFRLGVAAATADLVLNSRPVEEFIRDSPLPGARPQQTFEVFRAGALKLTLHDIPMGLIATSRSVGKFSRDQLEWLFLAEIDKPPVPPFQYRLRADPRLRIRGVSVEEGGAERLLRWSHVDDTLVVFLSDRATGPQKLQVRATMSVAPQQEFELPRVTLDGTPQRGERVALVRDADVDVQLSLADAWTLMGSPADASQLLLPPMMEGAIVGGLESESAVPMPRARVTPVAPSVTARTAYIPSNSNGPPGLRTIVDLRVESGRVAQFTLEVPDEMSQGARIETSAPAQTVRLAESEGRAKFLIFPASPVTDEFRVELNGPAVVSPDGDWTLPHVAVPGAVAGVRYLVVAAGQAVESAPVELPEWVAAAIEGDAGGSRFTGVVLPAKDLSPVVRLDVSRTDESPRSLMDVCVEWDRFGNQQGRMLLWLPERPPAEIDFDWPEGANPVAVLIDDRPQPVPLDTTGKWKLPLSAASAPRLIWLTWDRPVARGLPLLDRLEGRIPVPRNLAVTEVISTRRPSARSVVIELSTSSPDSALEIAIARWHAALSALEIRDRSGTTTPNAWLVPYARDVRRQVRELVARGPTPGNSTRALLADLDRRSAAFSASRSSQSGEELHPFSRALADVLQDGSRPPAPTFARVADAGFSVGLASSANHRPIRVVDRTILEASIGSLVAILLAALVWKTASLWGWLQQRESLAWLALGAVWWLFLQFSAGGLLLIAWTGVRALLDVTISRTPATQT